MGRLFPVRTIGLGVFGLLVIWQGVHAVFPPRLIPPPIPTLLLCIQLFPQQLLFHLLASLARTLIAVIVSVLLSLPLGILLGRSQSIDRILSPIVYTLYPVPKIAFLPVFMILLGIGNMAKVTLVAAVIFFQIVILVRDEVRDISQEQIEVVKVHGGTRWAIVRFILLPASLGGVFSALRLASGTSLAVLFFAETFFTRWGLGYFIMDAWSRMDYPRMYAGIITLGVAGWILFMGIDSLEHLLRPYKQVGEPNWLA
ncbi:MAG: ABC transporter permease subunit [Spirochaetes bacterium]|nr:ABC transporter permease subunit [Spirochaetota bacterium]